MLDLYASIRDDQFLPDGADSPFDFNTLVRETEAAREARKSTLNLFNLDLQASSTRYMEESETMQEYNAAPRRKGLLEREASRAIRDSPTLQSFAGSGTGFRLPLT